VAPMTAIFMAGSFLLGRLSRSCRGTRRSSGRSRGGSPREVLTGPGGLRLAHLLLVITAAGAGLAAVAATVRPVLRAGACLRALGVSQAPGTTIAEDLHGAATRLYAAGQRHVPGCCPAAASRSPACCFVRHHRA